MGADVTLADTSLTWPSTTKRVEIAIAPGGSVATVRPNDFERTFAIVPAD